MKKIILILICAALCACRTSRHTTQYSGSRSRSITTDTMAASSVLSSACAEHVEASSSSLSLEMADLDIVTEHYDTAGRVTDRTIVQYSGSRSRSIATAAQATRRDTLVRSDTVTRATVSDSTTSAHATHDDTQRYESTFLRDLRRLLTVAVLAIVAVFILRSRR